MFFYALTPLDVKILAFQAWGFNITQGDQQMLVSENRIWSLLYLHK